MPIPYQTVTPANANVLNNDLYDHTACYANIYLMQIENATSNFDFEQYGMQ